MKVYIYWLDQPVATLISQDETNSARPSFEMEVTEDELAELKRASAEWDKWQGEIAVREVPYTPPSPE